MTHLEQVQQRIGWLLTHDEPADSDDAVGLPLLELVPSRPHPGWDWLPAFLSATPATGWLPRVASAVDGTALRAGLLLLHDFIDESHQQSQSIEGEGEHRLGDCWHAILHRREPDYANAKYWFRQIGRQPAFADLARRSDAILQACPSPHAARWRTRLGGPTDWNPFHFVDLCKSCASTPDLDLPLAARQIQFTEMLLLFRQSYRQATGILGGTP
jgi:hypothetical protein